MPFYHLLILFSNFLIKSLRNTIRVLNSLDPDADEAQGIFRPDLITKTHPCNIQQYFTAVKMLISDDFFFKYVLIIAQNIDCGYTLEPPR